MSERFAEAKKRRDQPPLQFTNAEIQRRIELAQNVRKGLSLKLAKLFFAALIPATLFPVLSQALEVSARGQDIFLTGPINLGSHAKFEEFLTANQDKTFRTVHLNSPGGWSGDMREIARDIRKRGMNTAVDGSRAVCASACTVLFAAGIQRYYYNAERVPEGVQKAAATPGLGYHGATNSNSAIVMSRQSPGAGMQQIINMYYELGSSGAVSLATKADPSQLYKINGPTALSLGLATSLSKP